MALNMLTNLPPLRQRQVVLRADQSLQELFAQDSPDHLLAAVCYGQCEHLPEQKKQWQQSVGKACQFVSNTYLADPQACLWHLIFCEQAVQTSVLASMHVNHNTHYQFAVISAQASSAMVHSAQHLYAIALQWLQQQDLQLWRVWNYLSRIHDLESGVERYVQFNTGRLRAFEQSYSSVDVQQLPAACALGMSAGLDQALDLTVAMLAVRAPFVQVENPRQVSAFQYPKDYGPNSPVFSRAILGAANQRQQPSLWISGTASIVGHRSLHEDSVIAQCHECIRNVEAVMERANQVRSSANAGLGLQHTALQRSDLHFLVYVRHAEHFPQVQSIIHAWLDELPAAHIHFVQADICRQELQVEIEATAL